MQDKLPLRVSSMPEALRGKAAIFPQEPEKEPVHEEVPVILPVPIPVGDAVAPEEKKRSIFPVLAGIFAVFLCGCAVAVYFIFFRSQPIVPDAQPPEPIDQQSLQGGDEPIAPYPAPDTDSDGLTDVEELLYGTDFRAPDTDGDSFLDGNEVFHRYDPNGLAPSTLLDTGAVRVLDRENLPFTFFYPASWSLGSQSDASRLILRAGGGASVRIDILQKSPLTSLAAWMDSENIRANEGEATLIKTGYVAHSQEGGRRMYIDGGEFVLTATYVLGDDQRIDFLQTFKMMMNSVEKKVTPSALEGISDLAP